MHERYLTTLQHLAHPNALWNTIAPSNPNIGPCNTRSYSSSSFLTCGGGRRVKGKNGCYISPTLHYRWPPGTAAAATRMDSFTARLLPYYSAQSHFSFRVGQAPNDLSESIHDLLSPSVQLCPLETHDGTCLVMIVIVWEGNDPAKRMVRVRVTEPTSLPLRHQRDGQTNENSDGLYSYTFSLNMMPGMNCMVLLLPLQPQ
jgi:hypothetical protein